MPETPKHVEWRKATKAGFKEAHFVIDTQVTILRYKKWDDPLLRPEPTEPELDVITGKLDDANQSVGDGTTQLDQMSQAHKLDIMAGKVDQATAKQFITGNLAWEEQLVRIVFNLAWANAHGKTLDPLDYL